jgi:hypothetical protein
VFSTREEIERFLIKNKGNLLLNRPINKFFNLHEETLEDKYPVLSCHIAKVGDYLSKNVSYFSLNQLIKYSFLRQDMPGRGYDLREEKKILFGIPFGNITFNTSPELTDDNYDVVFEPERLSGYFGEFLPEVTQAALHAKVSSSSFFFWEVQQILDYRLPVRISANKFFPSLKIFKEFMSELSISLPNFKEGSFSDKFYEMFKGEIVQENFYIKDERLFVPISNYSDCNCLFYVEEKFVINSYAPFKRKVFIPENNLGNSYKFYMNEMLELRAPGFPITNKILEFLQNKIKSVLLAEQCWQYIEKQSFIVKGREIYLDDIRVFFLLQQSQIDNIKYQARKIGLLQFYLFNLSKLSLEIVKVRKIYKKDILLEY